ncbi:hypothetical protein QCD70_08635 [Agreia sp. PsM10]|uniref:hypothetical protein n=1 Tax=Agreia sp. PsM10 TaxID=3030533 RepID=UPI00263A9CAF|nr:hypothetical protein [Agreia sp. PsM10]MDN4640305.1 hypothetical protein [Agreia sp. PsM10]
MIIRRAFYSILFPAAVVLPAWMLIGSAVFGGGGWQTLGALLSSIVLFIALAAISGIVFARPGVRAAKAVSWLDVGILTVIAASAITLGFDSVASTAATVVLIVAVIGGFWAAVWQFFTEARRRVQDVFASFEVPPAAPGAGFGPAQVPAGIRNDGEYIVIETSRDTH